MKNISDEQEWKNLIKYAQRQAKRKGITEEEVEEIIDALRENRLYLIAKDVEQDKALNLEMAEWDITTGDGIEKLH